MQAQMWKIYEQMREQLKNFRADRFAASIVILQHIFPMLTDVETEVSSTVSRFLKDCWITTDGMGVGGDGGEDGGGELIRFLFLPWILLNVSSVKVLY